MMKRYLLITVACFITFHVYAQKLKQKEIPESICHQLSTLYPEVKKAKWEKEEGNYEAEFKKDKVETSVLFNTAGEVLETETEINVESLPTPIKDYVSKNYAGKKIAEAAKIVDAKGSTMYEAEVNKEDLIFDAKGNFIKKIKG